MTPWARFALPRALASGALTSVLLTALAWAYLSSSGQPTYPVLAIAPLALVGASALTFGMLARLDWPGVDRLAPADRRAVVRAVRRGQPVGDPKLAPQVISLASHVLAQSERMAASWTRRWWAQLALLVLLGGGFVASLADGDPAPELWWRGAVVAFLATAIGLTPWSERRRRAKADAARTQAQAML